MSKGWKPIRSAPKDGRYLLVYGMTKDGLRAIVARYLLLDEGGFWVTSVLDRVGNKRTYVHLDNVTHWMRPPAPPERR